MSQAQRALDDSGTSPLDAFKRLNRPSCSTNRTADASLFADKLIHNGINSSHSERPPAAPRSRGRSIAQMKSDVAHQIRSAQVVLDPAAVIKELLENALDAGASRIDVRVRGKAALDSIAVSDNGNGIPKDDYSSLCLSSSTSKISDFADLDSVTTFGFRGEALSAICAICKSVSFVTRTAADTVATSLKYAPDGSLQEQRHVARPNGTTIYVDTVFNNLPVRRKDALKNSSREIARCVAVVQALALISVGIRIELKVSQDIKVLSQPSPSDGLIASSLSCFGSPLNLRGLRHTASCVLGTKTAAALMEVPLSQLAVVSLPHAGEKFNGHSADAVHARNGHYCCSGLVSKASLDASGSGGRAKSSHQYIFANRRPVDFPRLTRAVNELYRRTTGLNGASPVLILNLDLPAGSHDVNLSPDKRDLLVRDESELISGLLKNLETLWAPTKVAEIPLQTLDFGTGISCGARRAKMAMTRASLSVGALISASKERASNNRFAVNTARQVKGFTTAASVLDGDRRCHSSQDEKVHNSGPEANRDGNVKRSPPSGFELVDKTVGTGGTRYAALDAGHMPHSNQKVVPQLAMESASAIVSSGSQEFQRVSLGSQSSADRRRVLEALCPSKRNVAAFVARRAECISLPQKRQRSKLTSSPSSGDPHKMLKLSCIHEERNRPRTSMEADKTTEPVVTHIDEPSVCGNRPPRQKQSVIRVNWSVVCGSQLPVGRKTHRQRSVGGDSACVRRTTEDEFRKSSMADPSMLQDAVSQAAELEMSRLFRQEWFGDLQILGQFNRGFIICELGRDLFIIDQHASDEKYNFEDLQRTTTISKQMLVRPLALELSAQDELIVLQHIDAFRAGGFGIEYRANNRPTQRLFLRSQPVSKRTMFVQDDLQDMVAMLKSSVMQSSSLSVGVLRPPRIRAMFASRACRKSVMIGTALQKPQMERIVRNLTSIEHPWTCPHGRPTMRHLCTLPVT